jgi:CDP-glucose 4,6-dehydratase
MAVKDKKFWRNRRTLITGATGLLGSWMINSLEDLDASIVCLVRDWVPHSNFLTIQELDKFTLVRGDLVDADLIERTLVEYEIRSVFHLAAQTQVTIANQNPISTFETNIAGTWRLLEACRRAPSVDQIIVASSDKAYGSSNDLPYKESTPLNGKHPYDVSKSCADLIAHSYAKTFGLPIIVTRCGNIYGGGDLNWNRLIPGTLRSLWYDEQPVIRTNGSQLRDYVYVADVVDAYLQLAETSADDSSLYGNAFNISTNAPYSVIDLTSLIIDLSGKSVQPIILNEATNEIPEQYLDASKLHKTINWQPPHGLQTGLNATIEWYQSYFRT